MDIVSKNQLMSLVASGRCHECFEHSEIGLFDITDMRARASELGELAVLSLEDITPFVVENRVIDDGRVKDLSETSWKNDPGIMIVLKRDSAGVPTVVMVDGHHRSIRRYIEGLVDMQMWMIPIEKALRPSEGWVKNPYIDWGDQIIDGKIVPRN